MADRPTTATRAVINHLMPLVGYTITGIGFDPEADKGDEQLCCLHMKNRKNETLHVWILSCPESDYPGFLDIVK